MSRKIRDLVFTGIALVVLFGMLVSINPPLRERTREMVENPQWEPLRVALTQTVLSGTAFVHGYADHHLYLFTFLVAAVVFFVLMLKVIS